MDPHDPYNGPAEEPLTIFTKAYKGKTRVRVDFLNRGQAPVS